MEKNCPAQVILARSGLDCNFLNELRKLLHREKYPSRLTFLTERVTFHHVIGNRFLSRLIWNVL